MPQPELEADGTGEDYWKLEREPRYSDTNVESPRGWARDYNSEIARSENQVTYDVRRMKGALSAEYDTEQLSHGCQEP
jgi:hypothetical protein